MRYYDITMEISSNMAVWPGDPPVQVERIQKLEQGAPANVSKICMGVHSGTHVDAPFHFLKEGKTLSEIPLDRYIGPVNVIEIPEKVDRISASTLEGVDPSLIVERVLFKTRNSKRTQDSSFRFNPDYVGIDESGAAFLVRMGVQLIGIDAFSVAPFREGKEVHEVLLEHEIILLEGLTLAAIEPGTYQLCCLPLRLGEAEGAPARAVLLKED